MVTLSINRLPMTYVGENKEGFLFQIPFITYRGKPAKRLILKKRCADLEF